MAPAPGPLETIVGRLNALKAGALIGDHAIGGAMAFVSWAEQFETQDLDVFAKDGVAQRLEVCDDGASGGRASGRTFI